MNILFKLQPMPVWMPTDNQFCRACDKETEWVLLAEGKGYTYPCCESEACQTIVREQIVKSLESKHVGA